MDTLFLLFPDKIISCLCFTGNNFIQKVPDLYRSKAGTALLDNELGVEAVVHLGEVGGGISVALLQDRHGLIVHGEAAGGVYLIGALVKLTQSVCKQSNE